MSTMNTLPSERASVVAVIDPDAATAAAYNSGWISMSTFQSVMAIIQTGTLGTSATVDGKLEQATDSSGTGGKDIAGKAITQLVKATNDDDQVIIECRSSELDVDGLFNHVRLVMTVGTATSDASAIVIGFDARHAPPSDLASVVEIVS